MNLEIHITPADEALTRQASDFLEDLAGDKPAVSDTPVDPTDNRTLDPVAVAAVVLSIPGAMLALVQLMEQLKNGRKRRELKARLDPLLESARGTGKQATLVVGTRAIDLANASSDEVLDALETAAASVEEQS